MAGLAPDVLEFYERHGYRFSDLLDAKRHGGVKLSHAQVKAGAKEYYDKIQCGEIMPRQIEMGWGVIEHAKNARYDDFKKDNNIVREYKPIIEDLEVTVSDTKRTNRLLWIALGVFIAIDLYLLLAHFEYLNNLGGFPL